MKYGVNLVMLEVMVTDISSSIAETVATDFIGRTTTQNVHKVWTITTQNLKFI